MRRQHGFSLFEVVVVTVVIGVLVAIGLEYYTEAMKDSRRVAVETQARNFTAALSSAHAQWYIQSTKGEKISSVEVENRQVFINKFGWPSGGTLTSRTEGASAGNCESLWQLLLQNPPPVTTSEKGQLGQRRYHISAADGKTCRYELFTDPRATHFFDYSLVSGQVRVEVPPLN
ncbi:prepilin-type N-terminal cleavage/methylation domain-containing protein [Pseudomaricurvus alkylphenolicus]|uniref:prepilin-type N-terminal cleavage/methylation domain-containing protein n=1 Tax=Pseudomaricurvus alkylphenolicus TaxID=1306991 RepID=UPI001421E3FD|nr:prepilin-type N-terminal cleavage/methylation domain-containing protein [Pseudomaricurvus alkylphenolicus]NIB44391.1 prepilin-type N-terminal cleavage/methylation domain-containing protein [Pseudomaricurvus alkylphenolicus]